ncbi:MAG: cytochrome c maturation protein CcmE, partial [Pseudomonadota bacterium]
LRGPIGARKEGSGNMKRKHQRLTVVSVVIVALIGAGLLVLTALDDASAFFITPDELAERQVPPGQALRLGGLVRPGSVMQEQSAAQVTFDVTNQGASVRVIYNGLLPDLFREGQGVVAEGTLSPDGVFQATRVLAKHDETYMPPELAEKLKESGEFRPSASLDDVKSR